MKTLAWSTTLTNCEERQHHGDQRTNKRSDQPTNTRRQMVHAHIVLRHGTDEPAMLTNSLRQATRLRLIFALGWTAGAAWAQLPPGPGRGEMQQVCSACHEIERSVSLRQDRDGWKATIDKMISLGAQGTEQEFSAALEYLAANYPPTALPPLNVNQAAAIDFETRLSLRRSEAARIIKYRSEHGRFKDLEELKQVPGIDLAKIEAKKDILVF
jgi:competence protein ComEA